MKRKTYAKMAIGVVAAVAAYTVINFGLNVNKYFNEKEKLMDIPTYAAGMKKIDRFKEQRAYCIGVIREADLLYSGKVGYEKKKGAHETELVPLRYLNHIPIIKEQVDGIVGGCQEFLPTLDDQIKEIEDQIFENEAVIVQKTKADVHLDKAFSPF